LIQKYILHSIFRVRRVSEIFMVDHKSAEDDDDDDLHKECCKKCNNQRNELQKNYLEIPNVYFTKNIVKTRG